MLRDKDQPQTAAYRRQKIVQLQGPRVPTVQERLVNDVHDMTCLKVEATCSPATPSHSPVPDDGIQAALTRAAHLWHEEAMPDGDFHADVLHHVLAECVADQHKRVSPEHLDAQVKLWSEQAEAVASAWNCPVACEQVIAVALLLKQDARSRLPPSPTKHAPAQTLERFARVAGAEHKAASDQPILVGRRLQHSVSCPSAKSRTPA